MDELTPAEWPPVETMVPGGHDVRHLIEHTPIRYVSHPYEWAFGALKAAALLHLDLQLDALGHGVQFSDASAYNDQFDGPRARSSSISCRSADTRRVTTGSAIASSPSSS